MQKNEKHKIAGSIRVNTFEVLSRAVEEGISYGYRRAHKHTEAPNEEDIKLAIHDAVTNSICEFFIFDQEPHE